MPCKDCSSPLYEVQEEDFPYYCLQCGEGKLAPSEGSKTKNTLDPVEIKAEEPQWESEVVPPTEKKPLKKINKMPGRQRLSSEHSSSRMPPPVGKDVTAPLPSEHEKEREPQEKVDLFQEQNPEEFFQNTPLPEPSPPTEDLQEDYQVKESDSPLEEDAHDYQNVKFGKNELDGVETADGYGELGPDVNQRRFRDKSRIPTILLYILIISLVGVVAYLGKLAYISMQPDNNEALSQEEVKELTDITEEHTETAEWFAQSFFHANSEDSAHKKVLPDKNIISSMTRYWSPMEKKPEIEIGEAPKLIQTPAGNYAAFHFQHPLQEPHMRNVYVYMDAYGDFYFDWRTYSGIQDVKVNDLEALEKGTEYLIRGIPGRARHAHADISREEYTAYKIIVPECGIDASSNIRAYIEKREIEVSGHYLNSLDRSLLMRAVWNGEVFLINEILSDITSEYTLLNLSSLFLEEE